MLGWTNTLTNSSNEPLHQRHASRVHISAKCLCFVLISFGKFFALHWFHFVGVYDILWTRLQASGWGSCSLLADVHLNLRYIHGRFWPPARFIPDDKKNPSWLRCWSGSGAFPIIIFLKKKKSWTLINLSSPGQMGVDLLLQNDVSRSKYSFVIWKGSAQLCG